MFEDVTAFLVKQIAEVLTLIGIEPGSLVGSNCHSVVETRHGLSLGRGIWEGEPEPDTGLPDPVLHYGEEHFLRAPSEGVLTARSKNGD